VDGWAESGTIALGSGAAGKLGGGDGRRKRSKNCLGLSSSFLSKKFLSSFGKANFGRKDRSG